VRLTSLKFSSGLRSDLEDHTVAAWAAECGGAIQVAFLVEGEGGGWIGPVAAGEAVQHAILPGSVGAGRQLEDHAAAVGTGVDPAERSGAVEIAGLVKHQAGAGRKAFRWIGEPVQDGFLPMTVRVRAELEHGAAGEGLAAAVAAAAVGRAIEVA
jgi:hypothetical protein